MTIDIKVPKGNQQIGKRAFLKYNAIFESRFQFQYTRAQKFIDSEVLRLSEPYIPLLTGTLIKTGIFGTAIGSGVVEWIAPYAARQYYSPRKAGSQTGPLRGPFWFERMKKVSGQTIIKNSRRIAGGGQ